MRNDLFVAHESIYSFAAGYASRKRVLDAGCGTGYGSFLLATHADTVLGIDVDRSSIAFAAKRYRRPNLTFRAEDLETVPFESAFELIVASNSLEHLDRPGEFLRRAFRALAPGGTLLVAVPPIYASQDLDVHREISYHRSNLSVLQWHDLLVRSGFDVSCFSHRTAADDTAPDFASPLPSALKVTDFTFEPVSLSGLASRVSVTAVFTGRPVRSAQKGPTAADRS